MDNRKRNSLSIKQIMVKPILFAFLLCFSVIVLFPLSVFAEGSLDYTSEENGNRALLSDDADLLSDAEEAELFENMKQFLTYGDIGFVTSTEPNSDAARYARSWYLTNFGEVSGSVLLIDMYNRRIEIFSGAEMFKTISTVRANEITDNIYTYATKGDYYTCADKAFDQMRMIMEGSALSTPMKYVSNAAFAIGIAFLINFIIIYNQRKKSKNTLALRTANDPVKSHKHDGAVRNVTAVMTKQTKRRHVESSGGGGGFSGGGGGGFSGGGGGGGFSGGGGGHSF